MCPGWTTFEVARSEGMPGAPDTFAAQIIPVHFAKSPAYRKTLQPWRGAISHGVVGNLLDHFVGGTASRAKRMLRGWRRTPGRSD